MNIEDDERVVRASAETVHNCTRFLLGKEKDFQAQFSHMYNQRNAQMRDVLVELARRKWEGITMVNKIIETEQGASGGSGGGGGGGGGGAGGSEQQEFALVGVL